MDWLDEIEEQMDFATSHYEGPVSVNFTGQDLRRMARVIRELVEYIKIEDGLPMKYETKEAAEASFRARQNLPDDAKELLG